MAAEISEYPAQVRRDLRRLQTVTERQGDLARERLALFRSLQDAGVPQRVIAENAGVSQVAVTKALGRARDRGE